MVTIVSTGRATLYFNGALIGTALAIELPTDPEPEPLPSCWQGGSISASFFWRKPTGRQGRAHSLVLYRLSMSAAAWQMVKFYHRIKHHQQRKRLANKSK